MAWTVEFFEDDQGRQPAREWLQSLDSAKRAAVEPQGDDADDTSHTQD
jgi:hypothetical protein